MRIIVVVCLAVLSMGCLRYHGVCNSDWMQDLPPRVKEHRLDELILVGTHDSAAYHLDLGNSPELERTGNLNTLSRYAREYSWLGLEGVIAKLTLTQVSSIYEQLEQGVRAFDFRILYQPAQNRFYLSHSFTTVPLEIVLKDIQDFMLLHLGEVIVIEMQDDSEHMQKTTPSNNALLTIIERDLGHWLMVDNHASLSNLITQDKRILLTFTDAFEETRFRNIWPNGVVHDHWPNQTNPGQSLAKIETYLPELKNDVPGFLDLVFFTVTPDVGSIVSNLVGNIFGGSSPESLFDYAKAMRQPTQDFMHAHAQDLKGIEIMSVDLASDELVTSIIDLNRLIHTP